MVATSMMTRRWMSVSAIGLPSDSGYSTDAVRGGAACQRNLLAASGGGTVGMAFSLGAGPAGCLDVSTGWRLRTRGRFDGRTAGPRASPASVDGAPGRWWHSVGSGELECLTVPPCSSGVCRRAPSRLVRNRRFVRAAGRWALRYRSRLSELRRMVGVVDRTAEARLRAGRVCSCARCGSVAAGRAGAAGDQSFRWVGDGSGTTWFGSVRSPSAWSCATIRDWFGWRRHRRFGRMFGRWLGSGGW